MVVTSAPEADIRDALTFYWECMMPDTQIVIHLRDHYDATIYGIGYVLG